MEVTPRKGLSERDLNADLDEADSPVDLKNVLPTRLRALPRTPQGDNASLDVSSESGSDSEDSDFEAPEAPPLVAAREAVKEGDETFEQFFEAWTRPTEDSPPPPPPPSTPSSPWEVEEEEEEAPCLSAAKGWVASSTTTNSSPRGLTTSPRGLVSLGVEVRHSGVASRLLELGIDALDKSRTTSKESDTSPGMSSFSQEDEESIERERLAVQELCTAADELCRDDDGDGEKTPLQFHDGGEEQSSAPLETAPAAADPDARVVSTPRPPPPPRHLQTSFSKSWFCCLPT